MAIKFKDNRGLTMYEFAGNLFNIPRLTDEELKSILSPEEGDVVYNITSQNFIGWTGLEWTDLTQESITSVTTDSVILTSFDEFGYDTTVKSSSTGDKHLNAIYEWLIEGITSPSKTDFSYTIEEDLSRMGEVENCLFWVNWFCEGNINPNKIRPALQENVRTAINVDDWTTGGYPADSLDIINIPSTYPISGSQNDESLIRGMLAIQKRGYKAGFIPVTRYINISLQEEYWRGTVGWDNDVAFDTWLSDYKTFYKHYIDMFYNNGVDLGITYLGSEMPELSKSTFNGSIQRKWVNALSELAAYSKLKFPNCTVTYAADWTEYRYNLDKIWVDKNVDRIGIEFYFPVLLEHSNNPDIINKGLWSGENLDYFLTSQVLAERNSLYTSGEGKSNLVKNTPIANTSQLNNWREWRDNPHYVNKRTGAIADATPVFTEDYINQIYDDNSSSIMTGTASLISTVDTTIFDIPQQEGSNRRLFNKNCWLDTDGTTYGRMQLPSKALSDTGVIDEFKLVIDFDMDINATHSSSFPRLVRFNNWLDIFLDTGILKVNFKQATVNAFANIQSVDGNYNGGNELVIELKKGSSTTYTMTMTYGGVLNETTFDLTQNNLSTIFATPDIYVGTYAGTSDFMVSKYYKLGYYFKVGTEYYGGTYNFEDNVFGVRNEYDARFELNREIPIMATEIGVASINGSLVEPNVFPYADRSGSGYFPDTNVKDYWEEVAKYGLTISHITGAYGSNFESDELHQKLGLATIIPSVKKAGVKETALYNLDARYFRALKAIFEGVLWYEDAGDHIYNHALNGKKALGYSTRIYDSIKPDPTQ